MNPIAVATRSSVSVTTDGGRESRGKVGDTHRPAGKSRGHPPTCCEIGPSSGASMCLRLVNLKPKSARTPSYEVSIGGCPQFPVGVLDLPSRLALYFRLGKSGGSPWPVGVLDSGSQAEVRGRWVSSTCPLPYLPYPPFEWPIHQVGRCVSRIPDFAGQKRKRLLGLRAASSTDLIGVQPEFRQRTQAIVAWLGRPGRSQRLRRRRDSPNPAPTKASDIGPGTALDAATVLIVRVS